MFFFKKKEKQISDFFTDNFVDIHSHLLPGIDDGANDLNQTIDLIKKMRALGIKNIITTPHVLGTIYPNSSETIKNKLIEVQEELVKRNMMDVSIRAAAEYMMDEQFIKRLQNDDLLTLKEKYILVEMSYFNPPVNLFEIIFDIQLKGYKPILAHPERYNFYHNDFQKYYKLKQAGCLFQLNILSLTDHYGKFVNKTTHKLLKENLYDFIGTDTHHIQHLALLQKTMTSKNKKLINMLLKNNLTLS